jgi:predicted glutamine amidotransferase
MCVLAIKPAKEVISLASIKLIAAGNDDGFGLAWVDRGKIRTFRGLASPELAHECLKKLKNVLVVAHWRMATHGVISKEMCHPFKVVQGQYLFHNGVVGAMGDKDRSDTYNIARTLSYLPGTAERERLLKSFGLNQKWVLFDVKDGPIKIGDFSVLNGVWYSNTFWQHRPSYIESTGQAAIKYSYKAGDFKRGYSWD